MIKATFLFKKRKCFEIFLCLFQGRRLEPDPSAGVIVSGNDLVLQNVDRQASGFYSCSATNTEGVGVSQRLELDIKCK